MKFLDTFIVTYNGNVLFQSDLCDHNGERGVCGRVIVDTVAWIRKTEICVNKWQKKYYPGSLYPADVWIERLSYV